MSVIRIWNEHLMFQYKFFIELFIIHVIYSRMPAENWVGAMDTLNKMHGVLTITHRS